MTVPAAHSRPRPKESLDRCALRAQLRGDPMLGTAFPASRLLLVEQPGPWGRRGLRTSRFDPGVADRLEARALAAGVRVQAIRRPGRSPRDLRRRWAYVDTRDASETMRWGTFDADIDLLDVPLDGTAGRVDGGPAYLVCANGKHDACCAVRGRTVAVALHDVRPDAVWETSHLGGDRFAANVLVLPSGLMYGRVLQFAADEFVRSAEADEVLGALLRGRIGVPPAAQAALAFAHEQLALPSRRDVRLVRLEPLADATVQVRLDTVRGAFDVTVARHRIDAAGLTCASPGATYFIEHRPVRIEPV